jgi:hypothetical protein
VRGYLVACLVVTVACATKQLNPVGPTAAPASVAAAFMQAVADSNLIQMGELWGTSRGSAATTKTPSNWGQRVAVMHAYLKGGRAKVVGEGDPSTAREDRRQILVELDRTGCVKTIPFTMIKTKQGAWLVNAIDLNAAGTPGRACDKGSRSEPRPTP